MDLGELARRAKEAEGKGAQVQPDTRAAIRELAARVAGQAGNGAPDPRWDIPYDQMTPDQRRATIANQQREGRGAAIASATPFEGGTLNPDTGAYENRAMMVEGYNPSRAHALVGGGMQGVSYNWGDEAIGAMAGPYAREHARAMLDEQQRKYPLTFGVAQLAGNVATAASMLPSAIGATPMGTVGRGAGIGAAEGAAFMSGEGETPDEKVVGAVGGTGMGLGLGAGATGAIVTAPWIGRTAVDAVGSMVGVGNSGRARRAVAQILARSGKTADEIASAVEAAGREGQGVYRAFDAMGRPAVRKLNGIVRGNQDAAATEIADFLSRRQAAAPGRTANLTEDAFGFNGSGAQPGTAIVPAGKAPPLTIGEVQRAPVASVAKYADDLKRARGQTSDYLYAEARNDAGPVDLTSAIDAIDGMLKRDPILGDSALAKTEIGNRLASLRAQLQAGGSQLIDFDSVLNVKEDLGRVIMGIKSSGQSVPRELATVYGELDSALSGASASYRAANDTHAANSRVIEAVGAGTDIARQTGTSIPGVGPVRANAKDIAAAIAKMNPQERHAASIGMGGELAQTVRNNKAAVPDVVRPFRGDVTETGIDNLATDPALLKRQVAREGEMLGAHNQILRNSSTADNLADVADQQLAADAARTSIAALSHSVSGVASGVASMVGPYLSGQNATTRKLIADALMSSNPRAMLTKMERNTNLSRVVRSIATAILRNGGLQNREMLLPQR